MFVSFALLLILLEVLRGWRLGVARQLARLAALIAAYFAAFFGGKFALPIVRPFFKMPDALLSILAGAVLALMIYAIIHGLGAIWFKRTRQHDSFLVNHGTQQMRSFLLSVMSATDGLAIDGQAFASQELLLGQPAANLLVKRHGVQTLQRQSQAFLRGGLLAFAS